jgi:hypothetical protein
MGPPVTTCGAPRNTAPSTLTPASSRNGKAENSRIRPVVLRTCSKVIVDPP